jgi:hypothetical protein
MMIFDTDLSRVMSRFLAKEISRTIPMKDSGILRSRIDHAESMTIHVKTIRKIPDTAEWKIPGTGDRETGLCLPGIEVM